MDGSVLAQLGIPDMRIPISYALSYPSRLPLQLQPLNLAECGVLEFLEPDYLSFPALKLAFSALEGGGVLPAVLNSANEIAVEAFLESKITFPQIAETVARTMDTVYQGSGDILEDILGADAAARREAHLLIENKK
jgi:1-deoxy-D-xylulose-5-phosphate reductoisomerase